MTEEQQAKRCRARLEPATVHEDRTMKMNMKLLVVGALLALATARMNAQDTNATGVFQTNVVMNLTIRGTAFVQSDANTVTKVRLTNRDILNRLGTATGGTFGNGSRLTVALPVGTSDVNVAPGNPSVGVRNGTTTTALPNNFNLFRSDQATPITETHGGKTTEYGLWRVSFDTTPDSSFEAQGFGTFTHSSGNNTKGTVDFSGPGTFGGNPAIVQGTASTSGKTTEVIDLSAQ